MGLNFADQNEANDVFTLIKEKSRRNKPSELTASQFKAGGCIEAVPRGRQ